MQVIYQSIYNLSTLPLNQQLAVINMTLVFYITYGILN